MITISGLSRYSYESISNMDGYAVAQGCKPYEDDEPTEEDRQEIEKLMAFVHGSGEDGAAEDDDDDDDDDGNRDEGIRERSRIWGLCVSLIRRTCWRRRLFPSCHLTISLDRSTARPLFRVGIWYNAQFDSETLFPRPAPDDVCATSWFMALLAYSAEMGDRAGLKTRMSMLRSKSVKSRFLRGIDSCEAAVRREISGSQGRLAAHGASGCSLM